MLILFGPAFFCSCSFLKEFKRTFIDRSSHGTVSKFSSSRIESTLSLLCYMHRLCTSVLEIYHGRNGRRHSPPSDHAKVKGFLSISVIYTGVTGTGYRWARSTSWALSKWRQARALIDFSAVLTRDVTSEAHLLWHICAPFSNARRALSCFTFRIISGSSLEWPTSSWTSPANVFSFGVKALLF